LFVKTYEFLLWLIPLTLKFPKAQRFLLAERLGKLALVFREGDHPDAVFFDHAKMTGPIIALL
jgi:hypothetical protein